MYFTAFTPATGVELWTYDGVSVPVPVADLYPRPTSSDLAELTAFGNQLVFRANNGAIGEELFSVVGSTITPINIYPDDPSCAPDCGSEPESLTVYNGVLYFSAFDGTSFGLFRLNGTTPQLLSTVSGPQGITGVGNRLVFGAFDFGQYRLYSYEIGGGASKISDVVVDDVRFHPEKKFGVLNGLVYFPGNDGVSGEELWVTDGTAAGTSRFADLNAGPPSSNPRKFAVFKGELYFSADDGIIGFETRATNGTTIRPLADIFPGPLGIAWDSPTPFGEVLAFSAVSPVL